MAGTMGIRMDGKDYDVRIVYNSLVRAFELLEGENAGTVLSGRYDRDLIGTGYSYEMAVEPNPLNRASYDAFYEAISAPTATHTITVPYGQTTMTYEARVNRGQDIYDGVIAGKKLWSGLVVEFEYIEPQRGV